MYTKPCIIKTVDVQHILREKLFLSNAWINFGGFNGWFNSGVWNNFG